MKKKLLTVLFLCVIPLLAFASANARQWEVVEVNASSTTLVSGTAAQVIVLKNIVFMVANATEMYLHTGDRNALVKLTGDFEFGALGGVDTAGWTQPMNLRLPPNTDLKIWCENDPGSAAMIEYQKFTPSP